MWCVGATKLLATSSLNSCYRSPVVVITERHKLGAALTVAQTLLCLGFVVVFFYLNGLWWRVQNQLFLSIFDRAAICWASLNHFTLAIWFLFFNFDFIIFFLKAKFKAWRFRSALDKPFVCHSSKSIPSSFLVFYYWAGRHSTCITSRLTIAEFILIPTKARAGGEKSL